MTSVVTAGSPIARIDVPASVTVLSLEHEQDVVPMLDGRRNEDSAAWVTVRRDLAGGDGSVGGSGDFLVAHDAATYAETATPWTGPRTAACSGGGSPWLSSSTRATSTPRTTS